MVVPVAFVVGATALVGRLEGVDTPETWRDVIYLEAGYLQFLSIGGLPLLIAFGWLSVAVLRRTRELAGHPGAVGVTASALEICWWSLLVLAVLDPHLPKRYHTISGTSMACPHAAGVTALLAHRYPQADPWELWTRLGQSARRLDLPSTDVGAGLVQAP